MATKEDVRRIVRLGDAFTNARLIPREPQRNYLFEMYIYDNANNTGFGDIKYYVKNIDLPVQTRDPIIMDYMDTRMMYSGKDSSGHTFTTNFWDDQSLTVYDYMHNWFQLTGDQKYNEGVQKSLYTKNIEVRLKDVTDLIITGKFTFYNCFPIEIGTVGLNYDDSSVMEIPMTFAYDYIDFGDMDEKVGSLEQLLDYYGF